MNTIKELIQSIPVNRANFEHIAQTGRINGSLLVEIEKMIEKHFIPKLKDFEPSNPLEDLMTKKVQQILKYQKEQRKFNK
ncbi:MAG: hypothetical protein PW786_06925 [Arachidicoccus sp.]|nr:hypothetical protein [Arachidicoccus sp.]